MKNISKWIILLILAVFISFSLNTHITNNSTIDINSAPKEELTKLYGIGEVISERIILARPIKNYEELREIKGIGPKKIDSMKSLIRFGGGADWKMMLLATL